MKPKILYALRRYARYLQQWHGGILTCIYSVAHYVSSGSIHHSSLCVDVKTACCPFKGKSLGLRAYLNPDTPTGVGDTYLGGRGGGGGSGLG